MIQDIKPHIFHNEFKNLKPDANDKAIVFDGKNFLVKRDEDDTLHMPGCSDIEGEYQYVFSVDDTRYFLFKGWEYAEREGEVEHYIRRYEKHLEGFKFENIQNLYEKGELNKMSFDKLKETLELLQQIDEKLSPKN